MMVVIKLFIICLVFLFTFPIHAGKYVSDQTTSDSIYDSTTSNKENISIKYDDLGCDVEVTIRYQSITDIEAVELIREVLEQFDGYEVDIRIKKGNQLQNLKINRKNNDLSR